MSRLHRAFLQRRLLLRPPLPNGVNTAALATVVDRLFLGTTDGHLMSYKVQADGVREETQQQAMLDSKRPLVQGKKSVEHIVPFPDTGILVAVCEGVVYIVDIKSLEPLSIVAGTKGVISICANGSSENPQLCITLKRKVAIYEYAGSEFVMVKEFALADTPLVAAWTDQSIIMGYKRAYFMLNVMSGDITELFPFDKNRPLVSLLPEGEFLLVLDNIGIFIDSSGLPVGNRSSLQWSQAPIQLGYRFPYVVALLPQIIEIHYLFDQRMVQRIPLQQVGSRLTDETGGCGEVYVSAGQGAAIYRVQPEDFSEQIKALVECVMIKEAIDLIEHVLPDEDETKAGRLVGLRREAAFLEMTRLNFASAAALFEESDVDYREVISFFPDLLPMDWNYDCPQRTTSSIESIRSGPVLGIIRKAMETDRNAPTPVLTMGESQYLNDAGHSMVSYFESAREKIPAGDRRLIDSALMKLYIQLQSPLENDFVNNDNEIHLDDIETYLLASKRYSILGKLYRAKDKPRKALELWSKLGSGEYREVGCDGIVPSINFLSLCEDDELVFSFSRWVLMQDPSEAMKIFTNPARTKPYPDAIMKFLGTFPTNDLLQAYMEFLVFDNDTSDAEVHTKLGFVYVDSLFALLGDSVGNSSEADKRKSLVIPVGGIFKELRSQLQKFIKFSKFADFEKLLERITGIGLVEEVVLLCGKTERHDVAIDMLVRDCGDIDGAVEYCLREGESLFMGNDLLYQLVVKLIANDGEGGNKEAGLNILRCHADKINSIQILETLPGDMSLLELLPYMEKMIPAHLHKQRDNLVVKNVSKMENLQVKCDLLGERGRHVVIPRERACPVCHKKISDKVFATYPNGTVVHFKCFDDKNVCPVTNTNFLTGQ